VQRLLAKGSALRPGINVVSRLRGSCERDAWACGGGGGDGGVLLYVVL
jgi:hypothetical protein